MPVKQTFDKKEDAPEWLRPMLLEDNGKFVFEAETTVETAGLKKALEAERKAKADFEKALKAVEGIDPEEHKRLKAEFEKAEAEKLKSKGDWDTREKQLREQLAKDLSGREQQYQAELTKRDERLKKLEASLHRELVTAKLSAEIAKHTPNVAPLLLGAAPFLKVVETGDEFAVQVVDDKGNPRFANVKGDPFSIEHLVEEFKAKPEWKGLFPAPGSGGGGAPSQSAGSGGGTITLTREQAKDPNAYRQAKEAAAKSGAQVVISE
ncbi:MAG: hypothetical protein JNK38_01170 [Acidobacteria bacterium]|nr:hypothetical protein [Acidobacteriota bacterium]